MRRALALPFFLALSAHLLPAESLPRLNFNSQLIPGQSPTLRLELTLPAHTRYWVNARTSPRPTTQLQSSIVRAFTTAPIPTEHLTISPDRIAVTIPVTAPGLPGSLLILDLTLPPDKAIHLTANGHTLYSGQPTEGLSIDTGFRLPFAATGIHHVLMIAAPTRPSRGLAFSRPQSLSAEQLAPRLIHYTPLGPIPTAQPANTYLCTLQLTINQDGAISDISGLPTTLSHLRPLIEQWRFTPAPTTLLARIPLSLTATREITTPLEPKPTN